MMNIIFNVRKEYFDQIKSGEKKEEYRSLKSYWLKRLAMKYNPVSSSMESPEKIIIRCGYPKKGDASRELIFPWRGYEIKPIVHKEFGGEPTRVIAIKLER
jgi:hypothetical protein